MYRPYRDDAATNFFREIETLGPGMSAHAKQSLRALSKFESDTVYMRGTKLYIMGWVRYFDESIPRRTMFCREFDPVAARFVATQDPDYEVEN